MWPQPHKCIGAVRAVGTIAWGALTWVVGAPESVIVFAHPVHDGFPVVVDLVKQG